MIRMNRYSPIYFLAGIAIGWLFLPTPLWVCGLYSDQALPAWVQAVGSVLAIIAATLIAYAQHRTRRVEEAETKKRRAGVVRQLLICDLESMLLTSNQLAAHYRLAGQNQTEDSWSDPDIEEALHQGILYDGFRGFDDDLDLLDPHVVDNTLEVIRKASQYRTLHLKAQTGSAAVRRRRFLESVSLLIQLLEDIGSAAGRANLILRRDIDRERLSKR